MPTATQAGLHTACLENQVEELDDSTCVASQKAWREAAGDLVDSSGSCPEPAFHTVRMLVVFLSRMGHW